MKEYCVRLKKGQDLKLQIEKICKANKIKLAVVLSGVGSLSKCNIRLAKAQRYLQSKEDFEIVSLTGTIADGQAHLHISIADELGNCIGGHLAEGNKINTTCELVLGILEEYKAKRVFDEKTGYKEIVFSCGDKK